MYYRTMVISMLALPASAAAHNGPHNDMKMVDWLAHLFGQHGLLGLTTMLVAMLLLVGYPGAWRRPRKNRQISINSTQRHDLKAQQR